MRRNATKRANLKRGADQRNGWGENGYICYESCDYLITLNSFLYVRSSAHTPSPLGDTDPRGSQVFVSIASFSNRVGPLTLGTSMALSCTACCWGVGRR